MDSLLGFFRLSWALGSFFGSRSLPLELWAGATFTFLRFSEQSVVETPPKAAEGERFQWLFPEQSCIFLFSINIYICSTNSRGKVML